MAQLLKPFAFSVLPTRPTQVIMVEDNVAGYAPFIDPFASADVAAAYADHMNAKIGVTPAQRETYMMRSLVPGSPATEADFENARPLLSELRCSAADSGPSDCAPTRL